MIMLIGNDDGRALATIMHQKAAFLGVLPYDARA